MVPTPWMVAMALQADGWYLRSDIIWNKPNPMPESVTDRPTKAHEYLFLLSKSARYMYDADAVREPATEAGRTISLGPKSMSKGQATGIGITYEQAGGNATADTYEVPAGRNKRSVWTIATRPYSEAHFATFPPDLVEPCILAGTPPKCCGECGAPWKRAVGKRSLDRARPQARRALQLAEAAGLTDEHFEALRACGVADAGKAQVTQDGFGKNDPAVQAFTDEAKDALGGYTREFLLARPAPGEWRPTCDHSDDSGRATVLDPFSGAATTGLVATQLGRDYIGIELNSEYVELGEQRIERWEANPAGTLTGDPEPLEGQLSMEAA